MRRSRGFTLVELLVVVAILAMLITMLMPVLGRAIKIVRMTTCMNNLRNLSGGIGLYVGEFEGVFPWSVNNNKNPDGGGHAYWYYIIGEITDDQLPHNVAPQAAAIWKYGYVPYNPRTKGDDSFSCPSADRQITGAYDDDKSTQYYTSCSYSMNDLLSPDINWPEVITPSPNSWKQHTTQADVTNTGALMLADGQIGTVGGKWVFRPLFRNSNSGRLNQNFLNSRGPWPHLAELGSAGTYPAPATWEGHLEYRTVYACVDGHVVNSAELTSDMFGIK